MDGVEVWLRGRRTPIDSRRLSAVTQAAVSVCGRFVQVSSPELFAERFHVDEVAVLQPRVSEYNIAPSARVLTVVDSMPDHRVLMQMRWGLVPSWARDASQGARLINARAETIAVKPSFRQSFKKRRCILPVDGFYEWQAIPGRSKKQPMFIRRRDGEPFAFAGLWETWRDGSNSDVSEIVTCAIVTTSANAVMEPVHSRMPVMLAEKCWDHWLDPTNEDTDALNHSLEGDKVNALEMWQVSTLVNNARNDGPLLVERAEPETLF